MSMIKCNYFKKSYYHDKIYGRCEHSPVYNFNEWDQADVESIISIDTCADQHGEVATIVVYYNAKETAE